LDGWLVVSRLLGWLSVTLRPIVLVVGCWSIQLVEWLGAGRESGCTGG